ncbi:MAG: sigma-70 family RNA polymerase sigma factor [Pirellulaceae bacterium]|nr:sigma-70 family RNA polymerase sigma factor [Pirellulaceae bacterium]
MPDSESQIVATSRYELTDPDVRLMLQVRDGSGSAFEELVSRYQQRLISILEHLVPGQGQAEDLTQEVFMRVYRARATYKPTAKFSTWLFTIANNVANNAIRKLVRRKEINLQSSPSGQALARPLDTLAKAASGLMPARQLARVEISEVVKLAIQSLSDRQRTALLLCKYEHMSYEEIGLTMDLSPQAVKSLLSRARSNLRDVLQPYISSGGRPPGEIEQVDMPNQLETTRGNREKPKR